MDGEYLDYWRVLLIKKFMIYLSGHVPQKYWLECLTELDGMCRSIYIQEEYLSAGYDIYRKRRNVYSLFINLAGKLELLDRREMSGLIEMVMMNRAHVNQMLFNLSDAIADYDVVITRIRSIGGDRELEITSHVNKGLILQRLRLMNECLKEFCEAYELMQERYELGLASAWDFARLCVDRGIQYMNLGKMCNAEEDFNRGISFYEADEDGLTMRGKEYYAKALIRRCGILADKGRNEEAVRDACKAERIITEYCDSDFIDDDSKTLLHANIASAYIGVGRYSEALSRLNAAILMKERSIIFNHPRVVYEASELRVKRGDLHHKLSDAKSAASDYTHAIHLLSPLVGEKTPQLKKKLADIYRKRSREYFVLGRERDGIEDENTACSLDYELL